MKVLPDWLRDGFLRVLEPVASWLIRRQVSPNLITTIGTMFMVAGGVIYGTGHIMLAGWVVGLSAVTDILDGTVARRSNRTTRFGAFYDSTLDRLADGALFGGLAVFFATSAQHRSLPMLLTCLAGLVGSFLISYTRARAESLGIDAKVGLMQRPERVVLLSAPQALFGLALDGWVLTAIIVLLTATAWITAVQRILFVYRETNRAEAESSVPRADLPRVRAPAARRALF